MLKKLCFINTPVDENDPILAAIAHEYGVPKYELVWEPILQVHDGNRSIVYHWPNKPKDPGSSSVG